MALAVIVIIGLAVLGALVYTNIIRVEEVPLPCLPPGLRLGQISDLHGKLCFLNGSVARHIQRLGLDYLVVTGDIIKRPEDILPMAEALKGLAVKRRAFLIFGNYEHDHKQALRDALAGSQVCLLENQGVVEDFHGQKLLFFGFDNSDYGDEAYSPAWEQRQAQVRIFLAHSPSICRWAEKHGATFDLLLCGHTHGNQIDIPFFKKIKNKYAQYHRGMRVLSGGHLFYVNRGLGTSHIPVRIHAAPEITLFLGPAK